MLPFRKTVGFRARQHAPEHRFDESQIKGIEPWRGAIDVETSLAANFGLVASNLNGIALRIKGRTGWLAFGIIGLLISKGAIFMPLSA
jgi:hypothetical protein